MNTVKIFYPRSVGRPVTRLLELLLNLRLPDTTCHEVSIYLFIFIFLEVDVKALFGSCILLSV